MQSNMAPWQSWHQQVNYLGSISGKTIRAPCQMRLEKMLWKSFIALHFENATVCLQMTEQHCCTAVFVSNQTSLVKLWKLPSKTSDWCELKLIRKMMTFFGNIVGITLSKSFLSSVSGRFSFYALPLLTSLTLQLYYILAHAFIQGNRCLSLFLSPQRMNRCQRFEGQQWTSFCSNLKCPLFRVGRIKETGKQTHPWHNVPASSTWFSLLIGGFLCSSPSSALKHHGGLNDPACKNKKKKDKNTVKKRWREGQRRF